MKRIQAYFQNEDQAEGVKARLQSLRANNITVESMPEDGNEIMDVLRSLFVPYENDEHSMQVLLAEVANEDYDQVKAVVEDSKGIFLKSMLN